MYINQTPIPGMCELADVGNSPSQDHYEKTMKSGSLKNCKVLVASLTTEQGEGTKFLIKNGFQQIGKPKRNPNSGHMILLLIKHIG